MENERLKRIFSKGDKEIGRLLSLIDQEKNLINSFPLLDYIEFIEQLDKIIKYVEDSDNPRLIVLESWLIIDFSIRNLLKKGLEIERFCDEEFNLLPQGFKDCINLLENFIYNQRKKELNPQRKFSEIELPKAILSFVLENSNIKKEILDFQESFLLSNNLPLVPTIDLNNSEYRNVNENWLDSVKHLDKVWFQKANKLNKVRNLAAHSFDKEKIYKELGIKGSNQLEKLKEFCLTTLKLLMGLK